jgi:hypothetical protein
MSKQIGRRPQNTYIGTEVTGITQTPYIPPSLSYKITPLPPINYKEVQKKAFKSRELVGQPKRENLFDAVNNMSRHLAYGTNTIIVRGKARKKETLKENIDRNNNRFTNKAIDKFGNEVVNITGNPVEYVEPGYEGNVGDRIIYPAANITTADVSERKKKLITEGRGKAKNYLSEMLRKQKQKEYVEQFNKDHPDTPINIIRGKNVMTLDLDQGPRRTHVGEMKDQGPPRSTHIGQMSEDVPHRGGLKTTGLTSQEIADLELSEEEMAAVGGEDLPITEEEKGALKTSGLTKKELADTEPKRVTTANINNNFERLVDEAKDLSYEKKLEKYEFIKDKLESKYNNLLIKYNDYIKDNKFVNDIPEKVYNEFKTTWDNKEKIKRDIAVHKVLSPKKENIIV